MEDDDFDDHGEFRRDDKDDEIFDIQPYVQRIIVEEKSAVHGAFCKIQTFYNDAPEDTTTPWRLIFGRDLPQLDSGSEEEAAITMSNFLFENVVLLDGSGDVLDMLGPTTFQ